jgi:hypothetical protein
VLKKLLLGLVVLGVIAAVCLWFLGRGAFGHHDSEVVSPVPFSRSPSSVAAAETHQRSAAMAVGASHADSQILFGDLHVHTTISFDAFMLNIPITGGQGAATLADACDFARHCAGLDFWSINDHASNILPEDWRNTVDAIRQCNDLAGDPENPDSVAFLGWEWTQAGPTPETHFGHKNIVLAHTDDARIPTRPIAASAGGLANNPPPVLARGLMALGGERFRDLSARWTGLSEVALCEEGNSPELPSECREVAPTPVELFRKLDEWGHDSIVIPHGTAWGIYTPPLSSWDKQLKGALHDPNRQTLIEVYSGHGDSEPYRDWRSLVNNGDGRLSCPEARPEYLPMCWRAGQIVEERCLAEGEDAVECAARASQARQHAAEAGVSMQITVPGTQGSDWLDAGQCRDCEQPAFNYRPMNSAQYITALGNFDPTSDPGTSADGEPTPRRFRFGFLASSDIHSARPGTGYKEVRALSESPDRVRPTGGAIGAFFTAAPEDPVASSRSYEEAAAKLSGIQLFESERTRSFLYTGGLVAVHAEGRSRGAIWDALQRKQVYGTSGPRILLWFDLLSDRGSQPMGSEVTTRDTPVFRVRAVGSLEQARGCTKASTDALGSERIERLCGGECYQPTDTRREIRRIEVVRIRPQTTPDEDMASLIDDPWQSFECAPDPNGCVATFIDEEFSAGRRDVVYYARVFEGAEPTVNGNTVRCTPGSETSCLETDLCSAGEDCLAPYEARAWSSPIFVDFAH